MKLVVVILCVPLGSIACAFSVDDPHSLLDRGDDQRDVSAVNEATCPSVARDPRPASCPFENDVVIWGEGWNSTASAFADEISPCTDVFISIAPAQPDKTQLRANQASSVRKSAQIHAMAEFHFGTWSKVHRDDGVSWREIGHRFRDEMEAAGYCVDAGDTWAINEAPSTLRKSATFRSDFAELTQGLAEGRPGMKFVKGVVFTEGFGHASTNLATYKANEELMLEDAPFWVSINKTVRFFADEVYADPSHVCMGNTAAVDRRRRVNAYAEHLPKLAHAGGAATATARSYLSRAYVPLLSAVWDAVPEQGYGDTAIPLVEMQKHIRAEVDATRKFADANTTPDGRIGFAFASYHDPSEWDALSSTIADAVDGAYDVGAHAGGACRGEGCSCTVAGAHENTAWSTFGSW